ncbi:hypothetical protein Tco_1491435 [Tanacetum coccineum]
MRELREDTFSGNKDEDAHDHIDRVLSIVGLFHIPGVSKDAVMLRVFPFTLIGSTKRWVDRLAPRTINTWGLLKKSFIQRYCPPSNTTKQLKDIHNFKQEGDESLYQAWERYNDMLYKCPTHDINNHQKTMADHSQKWPDGTTSRSIRSSSSNDGLAALAGCQICEGPHIDKDCPLNEEVKQVEVTADQETSGLNKLHGVSFISGPESDTPEVLQHQLPPKALNPGSFTLPCTIGDKELAGKQK